MSTPAEDPAPRSSANPPLQAPPTTTTAPWDPDGEHPLTRLELALAEVQRCSAPEGAARIHDNGGSAEAGRGPTRSLSVLEKVSRFERRERAGKQRSHSTCTSQGTATPPRVTQSRGLVSHRLAFLLA